MFRILCLDLSVVRIHAYCCWCRWDTSKFMVEHYADGDLVNEDTAVGYGPAGHEGLAVWGPDVPTEFLH